MKKLIILLTLMGFFLATNSVVAQNSTQENEVQKQLLMQQMLINEQMALKNMSVNAQINQQGNYNYAIINDISSQSHLNSTTVNQNGNSNNALLTVKGSGLNTTANQIGNENTLNLDLSGNNITGNILQQGNEHAIDASLSDYSSLNSTYTITQQGTGSKLYIQENGYNQLNGMTIKMNGKMTLQVKNGGN